MSAADSSAIVISVSGEEREVTAKTAAELFADDPKIVVARVNGVLVDLSHELSAGDSVEPVFIHEPDGLNVLRHSAAHVMAQAVQEYRKDAKLGIGPYITDGFYFDFDVAEPFTPEDLKKIEKSMIRRSSPVSCSAAAWSPTTRLSPRWRTSRTSWSCSP